MWISAALRFLPYGGSAAIAAILTWQVAGLYYGTAISNLNSEHAKSMFTAVAAEREACAKNQQITSEVSDAYQKKIRDINARHADAVHQLLQHEAAKRLPPSDAAGRHDAAAGGDEVSGAGDGAAGLARLGRAAAAEKQTEQLIACQDYVSRLPQ